MRTMVSARIPNDLVAILDARTFGLVLAGFISPAEEWAAFSDEWQLCLDAAPSLRYFKMREAVNNPSGAFKNWKRDTVRQKVHTHFDHAFEIERQAGRR
jgi:hypothetical protein